MTLRTSLMRHALLAAALLLPCAADAQRQRARPRADVILTGGKIFTSDFRRPYVQAIAIRGDRVLAIGTNAEVRATAGPNTREIALEGRTAIPGLNDARVYVGAPEVGEVVRLRRDDPSMRDVLEAVRDAARRHPEGTWLRATIGPNALGDRNATRAALDRAAQRHPVMLKSASGHGILLNSAALAELGMPDGGLDAAGGWLERDSAGTVIGFAHGYTQWALERALAGRRSDSAFIALVRARADSALRAGITSLQLVSRYQPTEAALGALVALESPLRWRVIRAPLTDSTGRLTSVRSG
jgi:predicted amidohydrolase YtcJ